MSSNEPDINISSEAIMIATISGDWAPVNRMEGISPHATAIPLFWALVCCEPFCWPGMSSILNLTANLIIKGIMEKAIKKGNNK